MEQDVTEAVQALRARADSLLATRVPDADPGPAGATRSALEARSTADDVVRVVVQRARQDGATWQVIGDALGVTRQAASSATADPWTPEQEKP